MPKGTPRLYDSRRSAWPWYYTTNPSGPWLKWTSGTVSQNRINRLAISPRLTGYLNGVEFYAIAFEDPKAGRGSFPEWNVHDRWVTSFKAAWARYPLGQHGLRPPWATEPEASTPQGSRDRGRESRASG